MMKLLLAVFLFSLSGAFACDEAYCPAPEPTPFQLIDQNLVDKVEDLKNCPTDDEKILVRVQTEYKKYYGGKPQVKLKVKGFTLEGSAQELYLASSMLGIKPPVSWNKAAKDCKTIQCALTKLFNSSTAAMQVMNFKAKTGYQLSLDQSINGKYGDQVLSAKEIQEMDAAASKLPSELLNLKVTKIDRMANGLRRNDDGASVAAFANSNYELVMYDTGFKGLSSGNPYDGTSWPQEVIVHELCHHHDFKAYHANGVMSSEGNQYKKLSGWRQSTNNKGEPVWNYDSDKKFVSWYAYTSPAEDYAETCMNYILHPDTLAQKAPEKYKYMKNNLFGGKEFKDKVWAKEQKKEWPELNNLVADQSKCSSTIFACLNQLKFEYNNFCDHSSDKKSGNTTWLSCGTALSQIQKNACVQKLKADRLQEIKSSLEKEDNYCENGGSGVIQKMLPQVCEKEISSIGTKFDTISKIDLGPLSKACEEQKDFTKTCIFSEVTRTLNMPPENAGIVQSILENKVTDRMASLGQVLSKTSTNVWLTKCLEPVTKIWGAEVSDSQTGKKSLLYDYSMGDQSGFLGKYIFNDNRKDVNFLCAEKMVEALKEQGYKVPESGNPSNIMQSTFQSEVASLEKDVFFKIDEETKKCLGFKKCKTKKILDLLKTWEEASPEQRKNSANEEFANLILERWSKF